MLRFSFAVAAAKAAAVAWVQPLAWELPYAAGAATKKQAPGIVVNTKCFKPEARLLPEMTELLFRF